MSLSNEEIEKIKKLEEAIVHAFPDEQSLQRLIFYKFEGKLLNQITFGETYIDKVFNLIQLVLSQGKLDDLIKGAYEVKPDNPKLKEFYNKYFNILEKIGCVTDNSLFVSIWNELYAILNKNNLINSQLLTKVCRELLQNTTNDLLGNCLELSVDLNLTELREILIDKFPKRKDGVPTILEFAERLSSEVSQDLSTQLIALVKNIAEKLNIPLPIYNQIPLIKDGKHYYFLLIVATPKGKNQFQLGAELLLYNADKYQSCGGNILAEPIKCDFSKIKDKIREIVEICRALPDIKCPHIINIQLFLPCPYLGYNFDAEKIVIDSTRNDNIYLGKEHPFLVSPYERFSEKRYYNEFRLRWYDLTNHLDNNNFAKLMAVCQNVTSYDEQDLSEYELADQWVANNIIGLKIMGCWQEDQKKQDQLFWCVVKSGIPFVLWVRRNDLPNCHEQLNKWFNSHKCNTWQDLFDKVQQCRKKSSYRKQEELGCHLGILADHPGRIPAFFKQFIPVDQ